MGVFILESLNRHEALLKRLPYPRMFKEKDILVVSYLGYENVEVTIGAETTYVEPIFKDNPIVIYGALRVLDASEATKNNP